MPDTSQGNVTAVRTVKASRSTLRDTSRIEGLFDNGRLDLDCVDAIEDEVENVHFLHILFY